MHALDRPEHRDALDEMAALRRLVEHPEEDPPAWDACCPTCGRTFITQEKAAPPPRGNARPRDFLRPLVAAGAIALIAGLCMGAEPLPAGPNYLPDQAGSYLPDAPGSYAALRSTQRSGVPDDPLLYGDDCTIGRAGLIYTVYRPGIDG